MLFWNICDHWEYSLWTCMSWTISSLYTKGSMLNINLNPTYFKFFLIIEHVFQDYIKADDRGLILMFSLFEYIY